MNKIVEKKGGIKMVRNRSGLFFTNCLFCF